MRMRMGTVAIALTLVAVACGSNADKTKTAKSDASTSTTAAAEVTSTTVAAVAGATSTTKKGATATTVKGATATTTKAATSSGVPTPAAPGTYDYTQSGTSSLGAVPTATIMKVDAANAAGVQIWHDYEDPNQQPSDTTMAFRSDGPFITETIQRAAGITIDCKFDPGVPAPPWPPTDGKKITGHSNCGPITADVSGSITGHKNVTLDGKSIEVIVATVTITTHGQIESTSTQEQWWAPSIRIPTHSHIVTRGTYSGFAFNSDITSDLKSGVPHS